LDAEKPVGGVKLINVVLNKKPLECGFDVSDGGPGRNQPSYEDV
jgi:hypothetical protein